MHSSMDGKAAPEIPRSLSPAKLGCASEQLACKFLAASGYRILGRNVRSGPGEIDVVASIGQVIAFVEVKSRAAGLDRMTAAAENVTARKQFLLRRAAAWYLASRGLPQDTECRFDVLLVCQAKSSGAAEFMLLQDAF
jgi:putative endonuclease